MALRKAKSQSTTGKGHQNVPKFGQQILPEELVETTSLSVIPEIVEELTETELEERQRLELKVERTFLSAGRALKLLRDKRLYRDRYKTFEEYCQVRFGFHRAHSYRLIDAVQVFENLSLKCLQFGDILPTKESQCRPLIPLELEEQPQVWQRAVEAAGGKVPSARIVKTIVDRLKEKPLPQISHSYMRGDAFILQGLSGPERRYNNCWAIAKRCPKGDRP